MSKPKTAKRRRRKPSLSAAEVRFAPTGNHPSEVTGLFKDDPTFEEFREILRKQRDEDYRQANRHVRSSKRVRAR